MVRGEADEEVLLARVEPAGEGRLRVVSPGVGWWSGMPAPGSLVGPSAAIGRLERLNRRFTLRLPEGVAGQVAGEPPRDRRVAVEHGQVLFELAPLGSGVVPAPDASPARGDEALPEGCWPVRAPTDGVFYHQPAPTAPPFVEPGSRVRAGQPVGLIEAMKTFNQILYGGAGYPPEAEVVEIRVPDAAEVRSGDVLLLVR